jgi:hypothetical protein
MTQNELESLIVGRERGIEATSTLLELRIAILKLLVAAEEYIVPEEIAVTEHSIVALTQRLSNQKILHGRLRAGLTRLVAGEPFPRPEFVAREVADTFFSRYGRGTEPLLLRQLIASTLDGYGYVYEEPLWEQAVLFHLPAGRIGREDDGEATYYTS